MDQPRPRVSFAIPVYNEEGSIRRCLDSILAQDFADFEVVVCDNASTDHSREIVGEYAARDRRVRLFPNETNIGLIGNFNRVFQLSRGEFFRWVGADDWLEPEYASRCVAALQADAGAIIATTNFALHDDFGRRQYEEFDGERLESERPSRRFARMLWFFHAGAARYEPLYSLMRREVLARTGVIRPIAYNDHMLNAELSLVGRYTHVPRLLFHRGWRPPTDRRLFFKRLIPGHGRTLTGAFLTMVRVLFSIVHAAPLTRGERMRCYWASSRFCVAEAWGLSVEQVVKFRRERLGLTRARLRRLIGGN
jgi:glycosyltransferase involved in cell wall biosynthesis